MRALRCLLVCSALLAACGASPGPGGAGPRPPAAPDLACVPQTTGVLSMDVGNCGGCGPTPMGINRRLGTPYAWHCCNGRAYDAQTDPQHCGTCDIVCAEGRSCVDWMCQ